MSFTDEEAVDSHHLYKSMASHDAVEKSLMISRVQIDKNVERELINHRSLLHPNIIKFREVQFCTLSLFARTEAPDLNLW